MRAPQEPATTVKRSAQGQGRPRRLHDKMDKTIVVSVERLSRHPLYKRVIPS